MNARRQQPKRKRIRTYIVTYNTVTGIEKQSFKYLVEARRFAVTKLGNNVVLTNNNGIVLPL